MLSVVVLVVLIDQDCIVCCTGLMRIDGQNYMSVCRDYMVVSIVCRLVGRTLLVERSCMGLMDLSSSQDRSFLLSVLLQCAWIVASPSRNPPAIEC